MPLPLLMEDVGSTLPAWCSMGPEWGMIVAPRATAVGTAVAGPPPVQLVNVGASGFDTPGDSVIIGPKERGAPVSFKVTARPGTILHFICVFHPWFRGRFLMK
ncbi:MAG: hypothetical protein JWN81_2054 [Solirubrobacterales bacterium]|nr:hypothetical protein [Solirubrobacterales bacterium]